MRKNSDKIAIVALCVPSAKKPYLAVQKEYILKNRTRSLGAVFDCSAASCSLDERAFKMLK